MAPDEHDPFDDVEMLEEGGSLVLADVLNHVFDKGVVISGTVTIGIADIDLVRVSLGLVITSAETELKRGRARLTHADDPPDDDVPVLPPPGGE